MSNGVYGTNVPIYIESGKLDSLVDVSYCYNESRSYDSLSNSKFKHLDSAVLAPCERSTDNGEADKYVERMYT